MSIDEFSEELLESIIDGLITGMAFYLAEGAVLALVPGAGPIVSLINMVFMISIVSTIIDDLLMYIVTGEIYYLQEAMIDITTLVALGFAFKGLSKVDDAFGKTGKNGLKDSLRDRGVSDSTIEKTSNYNKEQMDTLEDLINNNKDFDGPDIDRISDDIGKIADKDGLESYKDKVNGYSEDGVKPSEYNEHDIKFDEAEPGGCFTGDSSSGEIKVQELIGHDFEDYLTKVIGGEGSFSKGGRDFDGGVGNRWWEAKSGGYWDLIMNNPKKLELFKSSMGDRLRIAKDNGATYELITNRPIPEEIKTWLTKKGIPYTEILE